MSLFFKQHSIYKWSYMDHLKDFTYGFNIIHPYYCNMKETEWHSLSGGSDTYYQSYCMTHARGYIPKMFMNDSVINGFYWELPIEDEPEEEKVDAESWIPFSSSPKHPLSVCLIDYRSENYEMDDVLILCKEEFDRLFEVVNTSSKPDRSNLYARLRYNTLYDPVHQLKKKEKREEFYKKCRLTPRRIHDLLKSGEHDGMTWHAWVFLDTDFM